MQTISQFLFLPVEAFKEFFLMWNWFSPRQGHWKPLQKVQGKNGQPMNPFTVQGKNGQSMNPFAAFQSGQVRIVSEPDFFFFFWGGATKMMVSWWDQWDVESDIYKKPI